MAELLKGRRLSGEGAGKDRLVTKHGRDWRVRTVQTDALPTFAATRGGEATAPLGGGFCITIMAVDESGKVERGAYGKPLPLATAMLTIDAEGLARDGFRSQAKWLEVVNKAVDDAAMRRANIAEHDAWIGEFVTMPEELAAKATKA